MKHISEAMKEAGLPVHGTSQAPLRTGGYGDQFERMAILVKLFLRGRDMSRIDAAAALCCDPARTKTYLAALHDAGLIHVERWDRMHSGPWFPVYAWCADSPLADAPRPAHLKEVRHA